MIKDGQFQLSPSWGPNGERPRNNEQQTDWDRVCSFSEMALLMWVNRLDTQSATQSACGARWIRKKKLGEEADAVQLSDPNVTFRSACIANAALTHILEPAYRLMCGLSCADCEAYKSYLSEWKIGVYDVELAGWCQSEEMLLEKLSFVESRLQEVYNQVVRQLEMEQKAFIKLVAECDIEAWHTESGTFQLCRPCQVDLLWCLRIVWGVDRLWSSLTTFCQRWREFRDHHDSELNPSGCLAVVPVGDSVSHE